MLLEELFHFFGGFKIKLVRFKPQGSSVLDESVCLNTHQNRLALCVLFVEVVDEAVNKNSCTSFYLCHTAYGIKEFMFGIPEISEDEYEAMIEANVFDYIPLYIKDREREERMQK